MQPRELPIPMDDESEHVFACDCRATTLDVGVLMFFGRRVIPTSQAHIDECFVHIVGQLPDVFAHAQGIIAAFE